MDFLVVLILIVCFIMVLLLVFLVFKETNCSALQLYQDSEDLCVVDLAFNHVGYSFPQSLSAGEPSVKALPHVAKLARN